MHALNGDDGRTLIHIYSYMHTYIQTQGLPPPQLYRRTPEIPSLHHSPEDLYFPSHTSTNLDPEEQLFTKDGEEGTEEAVVYSAPEMRVSK